MTQNRLIQTRRNNKLFDSMLFLFQIKKGCGTFSLFMFSSSKQVRTKKYNNKLHNYAFSQIHKY